MGQGWNTLKTARFNNDEEALPMVVDKIRSAYSNPNFITASRSCYNTRNLLAFFIRHAIFPLCTRASCWLQGCCSLLAAPRHPLCPCTSFYPSFLCVVTCHRLPCCWLSLSLPLITTSTRVMASPMRYDCSVCLGKHVCGLILEP